MMKFLVPFKESKFSSHYEKPNECRKTKENKKLRWTSFYFGCLGHKFRLPFPTITNPGYSKVVIAYCIFCGIDSIAICWNIFYESILSISPSFIDIVPACRIWCGIPRKDGGSVSGSYLKSGNIRNHTFGSGSKRKIYFEYI